MIFLQILEPLEKFLERDKETRMYDIDWCLFDIYIKDKSLTYKGKNYGNLHTYMDRTMYYNVFYKEPLYMYLMKENYFNKLGFLPESMKDVCSVWNMKRVPEDTRKDGKYPKIPKAERIWIGDYNEQKMFVKNKFKELVSEKVDCKEVILV